MTKERLAIIGGGISGLSAAYFLHKKYDITVFEKNSYLGGHAHMVKINYDGTPLAVDTAVMIFDKKNYPNFEKLLKGIGVAESDKVRSDISWGASFEKGSLEFSNNKTLTQWNNVFSLRSWKLIYQYVRFLWLSKRVFEKNRASLKNLTFKDYLQSSNISKDCINSIIAPLYGCIFSLTREEVLEWPAETLLGFLSRHNMIGVDFELLGGTTNWHMIRGGTQEYVRRLAEPFMSGVRLNSSITHITRTEGKVTIGLADGSEEQFEKIIIATHADEALGLLAEPTTDERRLLSAFPYTKKRTFILHKDPSVMAQRRSCWAAFNCNDSLPQTDGDMATTYWLNLIQHIDHRYPLFLSINTEAPKKELRFAEFEYTHPAFTAESYEAQEQLHRLQGVSGIYYCGSYFGYACHEDGVQSAMLVSKLLGGEIPWE